ncbi:transcriptional regulator KorA (plasmid) [Paraburkholderia sprentiae WSM5005]|uniref:Transcriptional regulator KorA n=1 Tax=Paraburkholderia sprentiae WSM5005 TaxID=754502 RepID=A0A1I9YVG7_9BURK|nr:TrfB-related DNA-binding protein [Paraburkholderia sprentiae]APA90208.1 transcriptional regulator KorA [Paraburkholderia sprentiae WSM5005]
MTEQDFTDLVRDTKLTQANRDAARLVLVDNMKPVDAAAQSGISKQRLSQILTVVRTAEEKRNESQRAGASAISDSVAAVDASYAVAVKSARDLYGDDTLIQTPNPNGRAVGEIVGRTDFHAVQSVGRSAVVIHDLAKLDRAPAIGRIVAIDYSRGIGVVSDRTKEQDRSGVTR